MPDFTKHAVILFASELGEGLDPFAFLVAKETDRLAEIAHYHGGDVQVSVDGREQIDGILVVTLDSAMKLDHYETLYIYEDGKVAEAGLNQPRTYASYGELLNAAAERKDGGR